MPVPLSPLLDLIAKSTGDANEELKGQLEETKKDERFSSKVQFAKNHLPPHLKPGGHNPFDVLHDLSSDGLHARSDEECIRIFDEVRVVFEYLFEQLTTADEGAEAYKKQLASLATSPPRKASTGKANESF